MRSVTASATALLPDAVGPKIARTSCCTPPSGGDRDRLLAAKRRRRGGVHLGDLTDGSYTNPQPIFLRRLYYRAAAADYTEEWEFPIVTGYQWANATSIMQDMQHSLSLPEIEQT